MSFHPDKRNVLRVTRSRNPFTNDYILHNQILKEKDAVKSLGVTVHHKLSGNEHICSIVKKANSSIGFLRRNLQIHQKHIKANTYKTLAGPQIELMRLLYGILSPKRTKWNWDGTEKSCPLCLQQLQTRSKCHYHAWWAWLAQSQAAKSRPKINYVTQNCK